MPACPQCTKALPELTRLCPYCKADLDLLVDYVQSLRGGLDRAEHYTRAGELDKAVWSYLEVLEVEPDNALARRQVSKVVTAVRQFDRSSPGRKWLMQVRGEDGDPNLWSFLRTGLLVLLVIAAFGIGVLVGVRPPSSDSGKEPDPTPGLKPKSATGK